MHQAKLWHQAPLAIDKQKALKRDYIYNIENTDIEMGFLGVLLCILIFWHTYMFQTESVSMVYRAI